MSASSKSSRAEKLKRLARPLKLLRAPFYVQHATPETPLTGWWYQPAGAAQPIPLAVNYETAYITIHNAVTAARATQIAS